MVGNGVLVCYITSLCTWSFPLCLKFQGGEEAREVCQFHFLSWPDRGVPESAEPVLKFLDCIHEWDVTNHGPIVVHCSAGIGRTGTLIVLDTQINRLFVEGNVNIVANISKIRSQRLLLVQGAAQYAFLYCALTAVLCMGCHFIYNNGGRARFSRQHASTRSLATCGRGPKGASQHFFSCDNGLLFSLFRWVDGCQYLSPAIGTCTRCCATTVESLEERSSEKEGRRSGFSFEAERRSGPATANFSVRKSSL